MRYLIIRLLAAALCVVSLQNAWAGVWFYKGEQAFKRKDYGLAFTLLQKAQRGNSDNSQLLYLLGRNTWHLGLESQDISWFEKSRGYFEHMTQVLPFYGRGWLFLALNRIALENRSENGITREEWREIKPLLEKAYQNEPGSGWIAYMTGVQFLSQSRFLSTAERVAALKRIRKSTGIRRIGPSAAYLDKPSIYLRPALVFLHKHEFGFDLLKYVTPVDFPSYRALLVFLAENKLWAYRPDIYTVYLNLEKQAYEGECEKGEKYLAEGNPAKAFLAFRKAFWMRSWSYLRAKAGVLAAQERMGRLPEGLHPLFKEDVPAILKAVLEEEDEDLGKVIPFLEPAVRKTGNPDLVKLYAFRMSGGKKTVSEDITTSTLPAAAWWGKAGENNRLETKGRRTISLNLRPGQSTILIHTRSEPGMGYGHVRVLLHGRPLGEAYLNHEDFRPVSFSIETAGGKRWLQVDFLNGAEAGAAEAGPLIELGAVEIQ